MASSSSRLHRERATSQSSLVIRNVTVAGRRTSVRLEPMMWEALSDIARQCRRSVHDLVTEVDRQRTASSLTAAIRVFIVEYYRMAAAQAGSPAGPQPALAQLLPM